MSCYVYVLHSASKGSLYIGSSEDPERRLKQHNEGKVRSTRNGIPWQCLRVETCDDRTTALKRERYLKSGWGRQWLTKQIERRDG